MISPRNSTLGEEIYREIDKNEYLHELYADILHIYSLKILHGEDIEQQLPDTSTEVLDALRFADLLSKSAGVPNSEKHKSWAQEIVALLSAIYPNSAKVKHYTASVLATVGNYRGLQLIESADGSLSFLEELFANFDKDYLAVPHQENKYFFHSQKAIYDRLDDSTFSYSGPTSMGKSLLMRMFIKDRILSDKKENYAILVPTKALISEISQSFYRDLNTLLKEKNYKVVNSAGSLMLEGDHNFIFVLTPERLLYLLISNPTINIHHLFIDEAHKISVRDGRSAFYYKVVDMLEEREVKPHIVFASPNIPNPEVYLGLVSGVEGADNKSLATSYSPVSQLKYIIDIVDRKIHIYNEHKKELTYMGTVQEGYTPITIIKRLLRHAPGKQSIVYFSSKDSAITTAFEYAKYLEDKKDPQLEALAKEIETTIHDKYYLANLIRRGVAYHVGYLPNHIRSSIEKSFRDHKLDILFCTSTLVEGVNLPADNLFVMSYNNGRRAMNSVDFRNLIGRVGRIEFNLYGNVFIIRHEQGQSVDVFKGLISEEIPEQKLSMVAQLTKPQKQLIVETLMQGTVEFSRHPKNQPEESYNLMRKMGLILLRDIVKNRHSPTREEFAPFLDDDKEALIRQHFGHSTTLPKPDDDINISVDQTKSLRQAIACGLEYPSMEGNSFNHDELVYFLNKLCRIFKWDIYERKTLGHISSKDGTFANLRYYATVLSRWMEGKGLRTIIDAAIEHKQTTPGSTVMVHGVPVPYEDTQFHKNVVIADTLAIIDSIILFSIANYFLRFSTEYKLQHGVEEFDNDWYEYVEYGSTNKLTILLQRNGFSRETSEYIKIHKRNYVVDTPTGPKLRKSLLQCPTQYVKEEVENIILNVPELFV